MIELAKNQYAIKYRCPNCGEVYTKGVQKGVLAKGRGGSCPNCGVQDGTSGVGHFEIIKLHPELDALPGIPYNTPRM